jgi:hypothetical protein
MRINDNEIYLEYLENRKNILKNYIPTFPINSEYTALIIEPRIIPHFDTILKNVSYHLNENNSKIKWKLNIFHSNENKKYIQKITDGWHNVILNEYINSNFNSIEYNKLLKTTHFWKSLNSNVCMIFQSDSILIRSGIEKFINFDYIGAPWIKPKENRYVGNGGLSIRNVNKMIEITNTYDEPSIKNEDIYFSKYVSEISVDIAKQFSVEDLFYEYPIGIHNPVKLTNEQLKFILDNAE